MQQIDWKFWSARQALPAQASVIFMQKLAAVIMPHASSVTAEGQQQLLHNIGMRQAQMVHAAGALGGLK